MRRPLLLAGLWLGILGVTLLIYLPGLPGGFMYDDLGSIVNNPNLYFDKLSLENLYWAMLSSPTGGLLRPLSMLSFALNGHHPGMTPLAFKLTNICIHLACGILLWLLMREVLRAYVRRFQVSLEPATIRWLCFAGMSLWLMHPLNLTPVLYVVQRETLLASFFTVAAILCYLVGRRREMAGRPAFLWIWVYAPALTGLGLLCKETAALMPVYVLALEACLLGFQSPAPEKRSRHASWFQILFLFLPVSLLLLALEMKGGLQHMYIDRGFTLHQRLLTECRVLVDYLRWIFIPDIRQFALYHDDILPSESWLSPATTLASAALLVALIIAAKVLRRRQPLISLAVTWFFAGQLLESTVLPLELAFEHRNYLPDFGPLGFLVAGLYLVAQQHRWLRPTRMLIVACICACAAVTALRAWEWHSEMSFAQYEVAHQPNSSRALEELAWSYAMYLRVTGNTSVLPAAVAAEERAHAADPKSLAPDLAIANVYALAHDMPKAKLYLQATAEDAKTASRSATNLHALETLHHWRVDQDPELRGDIDAILENTLSNPVIAANTCYLADVYNTYGVLEQERGNVLHAASLMHKATSLCPTSVVLHINFAYLLLQYHDPKDAEQQMGVIRASRDPRYFAQRQTLEDMLRTEWAARGKSTQ